MRYREFDKWWDCLGHFLEKHNNCYMLHRLVMTEVLDTLYTSKVHRPPAGSDNDVIGGE